MKERKIRKEEVESLIKNPIILKDVRNGALKAKGFWKGKFLNVIFIKSDENIIVITAYPSKW